MRCGEWWASSLDLRGSQHPYPLLPTTHLADFCLLGEVNVVYILLMGLYCFYWFDVEATGLSVAFLFVAFFVSLPPLYFFPMLGIMPLLSFSPNFDVSMSCLQLKSQVLLYLVIDNTRQE